MNNYQKMNSLVWHRKQLGLALLVLLVLVSARPVWRALAAAGDFDTSFGNNGIASPLHLDGAGSPRLAIQPDGKVLAISANTFNPVGDDFRLIRMNLNGELDTTFSGDGKVETSFSSVFENYGEKTADLAIQSNGRIVVVGEARLTENASPQLAIVRFMPNGNPDLTFSDDGKHLGITNTGARCVTLQPDNKIVVAGRYFTNYANFESVPFMARYNSNGSLDTSFGAQGYVILSAGSGSEFKKIVVQSDGKILAANSQGIRRYYASGSIEPLFGGSGLLSENVNDFELLSDGKIVTLGGGFTLKRWQVSGFSDATFNVTTLNCQSCLEFSSFAEQNNGRLVVAGGNVGLSALARVNSDGGLDTSFGTGGYKLGQTSSVGYQTDVALMADQRIMTVGEPSIYPVAAMARYKNDNTDTQATDVSVGTIATSSTTINPGDTFYYTIPVKNLSATKAAHVTLKTNVPSGTSFVGASVPSGWAVLQQPSVGAMGTWSASAYELAPGATANLFFFVKVSPTTAHGATISLSAVASNTITEISNNNVGYKVITVQ